MPTASDRPSGPIPIPDPVVRAFMWTPAWTVVPLWLACLVWTRVVAGPFTLREAASWFGPVILFGVPLSYFSLGILGSISYRFLVRHSQYGPVQMAFLGALSGLVASLPFLGMWPIGFWVVGLVTGTLSGWVVWWLARRFERGPV